MRYVRISQEEFSSARKLYESVMSYACHGLFFREGQSVADGVAKEAEAGEDLLTAARRILISRGWVEDIQFGRDQARARGSIEVSPGSEAETCHRLRGVVSRLFEIQTKSRAKFAEVECESTGSTFCVFKMEGV
jgi:predicted hydrocarbon binding protein